MRGLKGLLKLVVVGLTAGTLMLVAAVGVSAASGTFGSAKVVSSVVTLLATNSVGVANNAATHSSKGDQGGNGNGNHNCKGDNDDHHQATGGHKNHPCNDNGGGGGGGGGGGD
jgi:hypothetical protein